MRWLIGYYYFEYERERRQRDFNGFARFDYTNTGISFVKNNAIFGSLDFDIFDDLTLSVEGRYAEDEKTRFSDFFEDENENNPTFGEIIQNVANDRWYQSSPRITLTKEFNDDFTAYIQWSEGEKPGGFNFPYFDADVSPDAFFNADGTPNTRPFIEPEKQQTYELGVKGKFFDGKIDTKIAFYYIDWKNQALNVLDCIEVTTPGQLCEEQNITANASESQVYGTEIEADWYVTDNLLLTLAYGLARTEITDGYVDDELSVLLCPTECYATDADGIRTAQAQALFDQLGNVVGNKGPLVPEHSLATSALYQQQIDSDKGFFWRNDWIYESKKFSTVSNLAWSPSLWIWNSRIGIESDNYTLALYVDNITNEKSPLQIQDFPFFNESAGFTDLSANPGGVIYQNGFSLAPRRSRNAGVIFDYRF